MNIINERLRAVRNSKEHIKKEMQNTFDIKKLFELDHQLTELDKEEQDLLNRLGVS